MKLAELQRYFASVATSTSGPPADLGAIFKDSPTLPARELLRIYNRGYHYRLLGVLASVFERTKLALGDAEFERLGLQYVARHPSEHPAVEQVGRHFAPFLAEQSSHSPALIDLARLEWARMLALIAPEPHAIALAHSIDPAHFPDSRLRFVGALSVLQLDAGALASFPGILLGDAWSDAHGEATKQVGIVVYRKQYQVQHRALAALEFKALALATRGATVSEFCEVFAIGNETEDTTNAFRFVLSWFECEWIELVDS
ncbi:MAG TPA: DNA-binding domain-containing protein [Polyangiaceae bacterium]|nr:DNA-binding domain-containing protein [Polyangiaceae bacterium]